MVHIEWMTLFKAIRVAQTMARRTDRIWYVFNEGDQGYMVGDDTDAETFYQGQEPVRAVEPDGTVIQITKETHDD